MFLRLCAVIRGLACLGVGVSMTGKTGKIIFQLICTVALFIALFYGKDGMGCMALFLLILSCFFPES